MPVSLKAHLDGVGANTPMELPDDEFSLLEKEVTSTTPDDENIL